MLRGAAGGTRRADLVLGGGVGPPPGSVALPGGYNTIHGWGGDDLVWAGDRGDKVWGGLGDDKLDGGAGGDLLDIGEHGPVVVDLAAGSAAGGDGNDIVLGFEGLHAFGYNDQLYGTDGRNSIHAGGGDDYLAGRDGGDELGGNGGRDTGDGGGGRGQCRSGTYVNCERG